MWISSTVLADMLEPALFALRTPSGEVLAPLVDRAQRLVADATTALGRDPTSVHRPSYDLGVATVFVELLGMAEQRTEIEDAVAQLHRRSWGQSLLHEIALIEQNAAPVKQGELAGQLSMDSGNLSRRIQELISLSLVERRNAGRLGTFFALTPLGRDLLDALVPGWQAIHPNSGKIFASDEAAAKASSELVDAHLKEVLAARIGDFSTTMDAVVQALSLKTKALQANVEIERASPRSGISWSSEGPWALGDEVHLGRARTVLRPEPVSQAA